MPTLSEQRREAAIQRDRAAAVVDDVRRLLTAAGAGGWGPALKITRDNVAASRNRTPETLVTLAMQNGSLTQIALRLLAFDAELRGDSADARVDEAELYRRETGLESAANVIQARCVTRTATRADHAELAELMARYSALALSYAARETAAAVQVAA